MIDRDTFAGALHTRLTWLLDHPAAHAALHGAGATSLGLMLPHTGPLYVLLAGIAAAGGSAIVAVLRSYLNPIAAAAGTAHAQRWTPAPITPPGPRRVLVVDDEHTLHDLASLLPDVATEHARPAYETLRALARDRGISVVLLDLGLPDVRSIEGFARDVRAAAPPGCVVIVTSGRNDAPGIARAINARCLMKPFSLDELTAACAPTVAAKP